MLSFAQTVINIVSGRDDDDELFYKKDIPDYRKQRNLIIMTGERDNVQVPLPYGINLFSNLGTILAELAFGWKTWLMQACSLLCLVTLFLSDCIRSGRQPCAGCGVNADANVLEASN